MQRLQVIDSEPCTISDQKQGKEDGAYVLGIRKLVQAMLKKRNATFKAWQNIVTKIEPFLVTAR